MDRKKSKFNISEKHLNLETRYRDYGTLKYWFRSVEKYAPWVNKIYFITDNQVPAWVNRQNDKVVCLNHSEFIPKKYLPTFNSNTILLNLFRIKDLSEKFVIFNDDMFLNDYVQPEDFFKNNLPRDNFVVKPLFPRVEGIDSMVEKDMKIINKYFSFRKDVRNSFTKAFNLKNGIYNFSNLLMVPYALYSSFYNPHIPVSHKKTTFSKIWSLEPELLIKTSTGRFRSSEDINEWLMRYWNLASGQFYPRNINFGKFYNMAHFNDFIKDVQQSKHHVLCLNDSFDGNFFEMKKKLIETFSEKYANKSAFEI